jgi:hypothetical protein
MILPRLGSTEALHTCHIEKDRVVYDAVDRSERRHWVFEDAIPGGKHEIGGNQHGALLITLSKQREEHLHLLAILLDIANVVQDQTRHLLELGDLLRQAQFAFGGKQPLHQRGCGGPEHRMALLDQFVAQRRRQMTFPRAWCPDGNDIVSMGDKRTAAQTLNLQSQARREAFPLKGAKGFLARQFGLYQVSLNAPLRAFLTLQACQFVEKALVSQILFARASARCGRMRWPWWAGAVRAAWLSILPVD